MVAYALALAGVCGDVGLKNYFSNASYEKEFVGLVSRVQSPCLRSTLKDELGINSAWCKYVSFMRQQFLSNYKGKNMDWSMNGTNLHPAVLMPTSSCQSNFPHVSELHFWNLGLDMSPVIPERLDWLRFFHYMRVSSSSMSSCEVMVSRVVQYGKSLVSAYCRAVCVPIPDVEDMDPRILYGDVLKPFKTLIRRDRGVSVKTTEPLSVTEAKSGHNFCDVSSVRGLIMASAFNFFNTSGGRRSRTLSSLRLRDVRGVVQRVHCTDRVWKVPAFSFELIDEKSINKRGFRCVREDFSGWTDYERHMRLSASYFLYALFMLRKLFRFDDPLESEDLSFVDGVGDCYVFCHHDGDIFLDAIPMSPKSLSNVTRVLTTRMSSLTGKKPRGSRAHRYATATNATTRGILKSNGTSVNRDLLESVTRWGGWSSQRGRQVVVDTYEALAVDSTLNNFGLAYGISSSSEIWQERLKEFDGDILQPTSDINIKDHGCSPLPLQVKYAAYVECRSEVLACRTAGIALMAKVLSDRDVVPIQRFTDDADALSTYARHHPNCELVVQHEAAVTSFSAAFGSALTRARSEFVVRARADLLALGIITRPRMLVPANVLFEFYAVVFGSYPPPFFVDGRNKGPLISLSLETVMSSPPFQGLFVKTPL